MLRAVLVACLLALGARAASGQHHALGYLAGSHSGMVLSVDPFGSVKAFRVGDNPVYGLTMDVDNRTAIVCHYGDAVLRVDPIAGTVIGTLYQGPPLQGVCGVTIDHHGDYYVADAGLNGVLRITPDGRIQTVRIDPVRLDDPRGGLAVDVETGDLLVLDVAGEDALLRLTRDGQVLETLGTGFKGQHALARHIPSGDVYAGGAGGTEGSIYRLRAHQSVAEVFATYPNTGMLALTMDRSSALEQRLVGTGSDRAGGIWFVDLVTAQVTPFTTFGQSAYDVDFLRGRNLQSVRTDPGRWELRLSFPEAPAEAYVLAASLRGPRPALLTPDGRAFNLAVDPLLLATMQQELPPYLTGNHGVLNLVGEARASLDFRTLGSHLQGLRVWFAAVILSPAAPSGIHLVSDPYPFVLDPFAP